MEPHENLEDILCDIDVWMFELNDGDEFEYINAHVFMKRHPEQVTMFVWDLIRAVYSDDTEIRKQAAQILTKMFHHVHHDCFNQQMRHALRSSIQCLKTAFATEPDSAVALVFSTAIQAAADVGCYLD